MQLNLKYFNPNTAMKTGNINADTVIVNTDNDLALCVELIGKNQDKIGNKNKKSLDKRSGNSFIIKWTRHSSSTSFETK